MIVSAKISALRQTRWYEYGIRFVLGGLVTVFAGAAADAYGPWSGGLFLAFPAIFSASATLIERHERQRKQEHGLNGRLRGKQAAALDSFGAALGSFGLFAFGFVIWILITRNIWIAFGAALAAWFLVSIFMWSLRRKLRVL